MWWTVALAVIFGTWGTWGTSDSGLEKPGDSAVGSPVVVATNQPFCTSELYSLSASPGEDGHWAATRLTPLAPRIVVSAVQYVLHHEGVCDATLPHDLLVWAEPSASPSAVPPDAQRVTFGSVATPADHWVAMTVPLNHPINVSETEFLFVAIEMPRPSETQFLCLDTCAHTLPVDADYWSNSQEAPFLWAPLSDWGLHGTGTVEAVGGVTSR